jgi:hypothetical protein
MRRFMPYVVSVMSPLASDAVLPEHALSFEMEFVSDDHMTSGALNHLTLGCAALSLGTDHGTMTTVR